MKNQTLLIIAVSTTLFSCGKRDESHSVSFIDRIDTIEQNVPNPATEPDEWLLAFIDVETTGLVPGYHEMIDIGVVYTDIEGNVLDTLFIRILPDYPERLSEGAEAVNAFDMERWKKLNALESNAAVDSIIKFHRSVVKDKHVLMVAYNCQFDLAFMDHLFRDADRTWRELFHYFVLDLPSMAWALGIRDLTGSVIAEQFGIEDESHIPEQHTGITGAMFNVRIYKALIKA